MRRGASWPASQLQRFPSRTATACNKWDTAFDRSGVVRIRLTTAQRKRPIRQERQLLKIPIRILLASLANWRFAQLSQRRCREGLATVPAAQPERVAAGARRRRLSRSLAAWVTIHNPKTHARQTSDSAGRAAQARLSSTSAINSPSERTAPVRAMRPVAAVLGRAALPGVWFGPSVFKSTSCRTRQGARPNEGSRAPHAECDAPPKAGPERDALGDHQKN